MLTERQQDIVDAAMQIVVEQGTHKLTIRNVAAAIGVSEPAVYRHFASKHDLLVALLETLQSSITTLFAQVKTHHQPFGVFVETLLSSLFAKIASNRAFALFVFTEEAFHADAELRPLLARMLDEMIDMLQGIIATYQESGSCRSDLPSHSIATMLLGTIRLTVTRWHLNHETVPLTEYAAHLVPTIKTLFSP